MITEQPMWTDVWQTIAALISIPAAIVGFIILFIKDRNKENQIQKLSDIAENLKEMVADSEKRYIQTRKPIITISIHHLPENQAIKVVLINSNQQSHVRYYEPLDIASNKYSISASNRAGEKQDLSILFYYKDSPQEYDRSVIQVKYVTTEGYIFKQLLQFDVSKNDIQVYQDPILDISAQDY